MDINALMRQAQNMQRQITKKQKEVEEKEFTINSNGGAIQVSIKGDKKILDIKIDPDLIDVSNQEMLQEMLIIAVNEAISKVEDEMSKVMNGATGGMNIPGMF
jgi:DNA-binding YbaB/EbfC family protein